MNPAAYLRDRRDLNLLLIMAWSTMIFYGSSVPQEDMPAGLSPYSSLFHFMEYLVLGFLARPYVRAPNAVLVAALAGSLFGVSDELHQIFVPGRDASAGDWALDAAGSFAGALAAKAWGRL